MWSLTLPDPLRSTGPHGVRLEIPHIDGGSWITSKWPCWLERYNYVAKWLCQQAHQAPIRLYSQAWGTHRVAAEPALGQQHQAVTI